MADTPRSEHRLVELVIELIKAITWPGMILFVLMWFHQPIISILADSEKLAFEAFGLSLSASKADKDVIKQLQDKEARLLQDIGDLRTLTVNLQRERDALLASNRDLTQRLQDTLGELQPNEGDIKTQIQDLDRYEAETRRIADNPDVSQQIAVAKVGEAQRQLDKGRFDSAASLERAGFDDLVDGDWADATANFDAAKEAYPAYHNVDEISSLLRARLGQLQSRDVNVAHAARIAVYETIVDKLSWGMPEDVKRKMEDYLILEHPPYVVSALYGAQRKEISDRIAALRGTQRPAAVESLLTALQPPNASKSYRVNLYISRTLAEMTPDWDGTPDQCGKLAAHTRDTPDYRDPTFRLWTDRALKECT